MPGVPAPRLSTPSLCVFSMWLPLVQSRWDALNAKAVWPQHRVLLESGSELSRPHKEVAWPVQRLDRSEAWTASGHNLESLSNMSVT